MASAASSSKKRKRNEEDDAKHPGEYVTFALAENEDSAAVGPLLASFPAIVPPKATEYKCYERGTKTKKDDVEFASKRLFVGGESDSVEYFTTDESEEASKGCKYIIGVRNKKTNVVTLRQAPIQIFTRRVKALKGIVPTTISPEERILARNALGEAFGTKKAQKAIRAAERNKVDVSAMEGVTSHIQDSIEANTLSLPTQEQAKEIDDNNRSIPRFNADATSPSNVYKLYDIIPETEFSAIDLEDVLSSKTEAERMSCMPFPHSGWVRQHVISLCSMSKPDKKALKIVLYVSTMLAFRKFAAQGLCNNREELQKRMARVPSIVMEGLLSRFTESMRGTTDTRYTTDSQVLLFTHMFALCLRVDKYATDFGLIAKDMSLNTTNIATYFKMLGCKIETLSSGDLAKLGLPAIALGTKRAVLKVPLEFPKPRMKRKAK